MVLPIFIVLLKNLENISTDFRSEMNHPIENIYNPK